MDLESVADELYGQPPDLFVGRRTERVLEARAAGDRTLATAIGQLRRPTRPAWLVNLLVRQSPDDVALFLDLGPALVEASRRLSGPDLRKLSSQRQAAVSALTRRARVLAAERGHPATEATQQEVSQTLLAALADPAVADLVRLGRVVQAANYGGFGPALVMPGSQARLPESLGPPKAAGEDPSLVRARRVVDKASTALSLAKDKASTAEVEANLAMARVDELADQVARLRRELASATDQERAARDQAGTASGRYEVLAQAANDAEDALVVASRQLEDLPP